MSQYIDALIALKKYARAQSIISASLKTVDQSRGGEITLSQAKLYFAKGNYKGALASATQARKIAKDKYDAEIKKTGLSESAAYGFPASYGEAAIVQAQSNEKLGDWKGAVAAYDEYLKTDATAADIMIARGYAKIEIGDKAGAKADFEAALVFVADDERALAGLKKIGAAK